MSPNTRTGAQFLVESLARAGVKYLFGIPGHGNVSVFDAARDLAPEMNVVQVKHEQWGGHMADGYFRANRKTPAAVTTSVGPGATNLATALATAYVDSSSFIAITGQIQTYLFGMGIFQEIERQQWVDFPNAMKHLVKGSWQVTTGAQLPRVVVRALRTALEGRPGPVLIDLPMDVQVERLSYELPDAGLDVVQGRTRPDPDSVMKAAKLLLSAERPVVLIGGGVTMSGATEEVVKLAEFLGAPVLCSFRGDAKGGFPEDHELYAFHPGNVSTAVSNEVAKSADVVLAVGVTFSDETTSSYRPGVTFNIPPTKVVQVDIDVHEIGKNYPVAVGMVADARSAVSDINAALVSLGRRGDYHGTAWFERLKELKSVWADELQRLRQAAPMGMPNLVAVMRERVPREAIITVSAGLPQEVLSQQWVAYRPQTFISSGGFSTMGFALPAAIGAKLAKPQTPVIAVEGDGSFMMNNVELSTAVQLQMPLVVVLLNNRGWISIRDLQIRSFKNRLVATEFKKADGSEYSIDFEKIVRAYGAEHIPAKTPQEFGTALESALKMEVPVVVEASVESAFPRSGTSAFGFWDIPSPYGG
ncbi:MAG: thiamine pyrophosphate-binding protein [Thaumarchaeota archaeon]|nr:thiamine pyrophosphate-binding protein [Nitrososphaerota archaeon]